MRYRFTHVKMAKSAQHWVGCEAKGTPATLIQHQLRVPESRPSHTKHTRRSSSQWLAALRATQPGPGAHWKAFHRQGRPHRFRQALCTARRQGGRMGRARPPPPRSLTCPSPHLQLSVSRTAPLQAYQTGRSPRLWGRGHKRGLTDLTISRYSNAHTTCS